MARGILMFSACCWMFLGAPVVGGEKAPLLMSAEKARSLRALMPRVADESIRNLLADPGLLLYTEDEMPPCYQAWDGSLPGVHSVYYNISADRGEPYGNGNREFPWRAPGGTHRSANVGSFRFVWLPPAAGGKRWPIVWYRLRFSGDERDGYGWLFPVGAVVGEVLTMRSPSGREVPFEVRVRIREKRDWAVDVFRPFPTPESLADRIVAVRSDWEQQPDLKALVTDLRTDRPLVKHRLSDPQGRPNTFSESMGVDELPPIADENLVIRLLTEATYGSVLGLPWRTGTNGISTAAPTTQAAFHIVPAEYDAGFIAVDSQSCMRCHSTTTQHVRDFQFGRDWYGRIRGSDGIFSFHPFDPGSISYNGYEVPVHLRQELLDAGVVAPYSPQAHPSERYHRIPGLEAQQ